MEVPVKVELTAESVAIYPTSMPGVVEVAFTSTNVNDDFSILVAGPIVVTDETEPKIVTFTDMSWVNWEVEADHVNHYAEPFGYGSFADRMLTPDIADRLFG
jgi:hypothetical protein